MVKMKMSFTLKCYIGRSTKVRNFAKDLCHAFSTGLYSDSKVVKVHGSMPSIWQFWPLRCSFHNLNWELFGVLQFSQVFISDVTHLDKNTVTVIPFLQHPKSLSSSIPTLSVKRNITSSGRRSLKSTAS